MVTISTVVQRVAETVQSDKFVLTASLGSSFLSMVLYLAQADFRRAQHSQYQFHLVSRVLALNSRKAHPIALIPHHLSTAPPQTSYEEMEAQKTMMVIYMLGALVDPAF